jgi:hypothetical protein
VSAVLLDSVTGYRRHHLPQVAAVVARRREKPVTLSLSGGRRWEPQGKDRSVTATDPKAVVKKVVGPVVRRFEQWFAPRLVPSVSDPRSSYVELNDVYRQVMSEGGSGLRSHFTWCVVQAAHLAKALGQAEISVIEFGVAGGNGLLALERAAELVEPHFAVGIEVYGFDAKTGLPRPQDHRDLPNLYQEGYFPLDEERLRARLTRADLFLGLVKETVPDFLATGPSPVGFISFDLDLYSSTVDAFEILAASPALLLPRVHCYFDDIFGYTFGDYNGERLAIAEFNAAGTDRKLSPIYGLRHFVTPDQFHAMWTEQIYLAHILDHELYNQNDGLWKGAEIDLEPPDAREGS